ncbi:MAG: sulfur carrier protein ThiS [Planctomycetota bacterium]
MRTLVINGEERVFAESQMPATLSELLSGMKVNEATVVAEINGSIIDRKSFSQTRLSNGQKIELIRFVGGG